MDDGDGTTPGSRSGRGPGAGPTPRKPGQIISRVLLLAGLLLLLYVAIVVSRALG